MWKTQPPKSPLSGGLSTQFPPDKGARGLGMTNIEFLHSLNSTIHITETKGQPKFLTKFVMRELCIYCWKHAFSRAKVVMTIKHNESFARVGFLFASKEKAHGMREFILINDRLRPLLTSLADKKLLCKGHHE